MNSFSSKPSSEPLRLVFLRLVGWLGVVTVVVLSLIQLPSTNISIAHSDKWLHLLTYTGLTYWFFHTYFNHQSRLITGFITLGLLLELLQSLTPFRFLEWLDMLMNIIGVLVAYVIFWLFKIRIKWLLVT